MASTTSQVKPWAPLEATVPSVSSPTNAQTVKNTMSKRRSDLTSLLFSSSASAVVCSTVDTGMLRSVIGSLLLDVAPQPACTLCGPPNRCTLPSGKTRWRARGRSVEAQRGAGAQRRLQAPRAVRDALGVGVVDGPLGRRQRRRADAVAQLAKLG